MYKSHVTITYYFMRLKFFKIKIFSQFWQAEIDFSKSLPGDHTSLQKKLATLRPANWRGEGEDSTAHSLVIETI